MEDSISLHPYGTALPSLEEDTLFKEKPKRVEDQIVTDENGKRRFHGAFTGGFSAGYWNTVGSQEGWTPQSFKSSRAEKAMRLQQKAADFMDDEDMGEFGFAPQRLQVRDEYGSAAAGTSHEGRKRKLQLPSSFGGESSDVLHNIFEPVKNTVGVKILKSMGWRPGQGIGPRQTRKEKKQTAAYNKREMYIMQKYGCDAPKKTDGDENDIEELGSTDDDSDEEITFAPDDFDAFDPCLHKPKENYFGLGYSGLSRDLVLSGGKDMTSQHINLFGPLEIMGKNNKKLSITGQAFGVGALEEDDDDIYHHDDMSKYDFSLEDKSDKKSKRKIKAVESILDSFILEGFVAEMKSSLIPEENYEIELPKNWKPRNWAKRKSRFAPLDDKQLRAIEKRSQQLTKSIPKDSEDCQLLDASEKNSQIEQDKINLERAKEKYTKRDDKTKELLERISAKSSGFVRGGIIAIDGTVQDSKEAEKSSNIELSTTFQPFAYDEAKQKRYEDFIAANVVSEPMITEYLNTIQPLHLSEWDREMEKKEFIQARKLYKPLDGLMANRFVSETAIQAETTAKETKKIKDRVIIVRTKVTWKPASLLCKRFNIADPFDGMHGVNDDQKMQKKSKLSVFDYLEGSVNSKSNFITPVVIPKHIDNTKEIIKNTIDAKNQNITNMGKFEEINKPSTSTAKETELAKDIDKEVIEQTSTSRNLTFVPKTDLEKRVMETRDLPIEEKRDIFKSIFADSDDEDESDETAKPSMLEVKDQPIKELLINKSAASLNLLRNASPPRGIFAALFETNAIINKSETTKNNAKDSGEGDSLEPPTKIKFLSKGQRRDEGNVFHKDECNEISAENIYGPKVPTNLLKQQHPLEKHNATSEQVDQSAGKTLSYKGVQIVEEWVEKSKVSDMDSTNSSDDSDSNSERSTKKKIKKSKKSKKNKKSLVKKSKKSKKKKVKTERHKSSKSKKR